MVCKPKMQDKDIDIAIIDGKYDLRSYQCPMNLVIAKHIIYTKNPQSVAFLLASEQATINIANFLQFKGFKTEKTQLTIQGLTYYTLLAKM